MSAIRPSRWAESMSMGEFLDRLQSPVGVATGTLTSVMAWGPDTMTRPILLCAIGVFGSVAGSLFVDSIRRWRDKKDREAQDIEQWKQANLSSLLAEVRKEVGELKDELERVSGEQKADHEGQGLRPVTVEKGGK